MRSLVPWTPVDAGWWAAMIGHHGAEAPLGYYIFSRKGADGSFGSYGTGRAVVYLPSNGKGWPVGRRMPEIFLFSIELNGRF